MNDSGNTSLQPFLMSNIQSPGEHDLLLGRGGETNGHSGNIRFRRFVAKYKDRYMQASRADKPRIAAELVAQWRSFSPPGRFLARMDPGRTDSEWYDIGDTQARKRASKSLGERGTKSSATTKARPATTPKVDSSRKRTRESTLASAFLDIQTERALTCMSPSSPLIGGNDSCQTDQVFYTVDSPFQRRHSLDLEGRVPLILKEEGQKAINSFGMPALDLSSLPTAAALVSSVFQTSSEEIDYVHMDECGTANSGTRNSGF